MTWKLRKQDKIKYDPKVKQATVRSDERHHRSRYAKLKFEFVRVQALETAPAQGGDHSTNGYVARSPFVPCGPTF